MSKQYWIKYDVESVNYDFKFDDKPFSLPTDLTKEGYKFIGWINPKLLVCRY